VIYGNHPYGAVGSIASLKAITRQDLQDYYARVVVPGGMILVAVGDFTPTEMLAKLRARFGDWKREMPPGNQTVAFPPTKPRLLVVDKPDATQTQVRLARTALPRNHPDFFPSQVAINILGGGFTSRLTDEIRVNRSLTYGIGASFDRKKVGGDFTVSTFTKIETTRALLDATRGVLKKAATQGFTSSELTKVKGYLSGLFAIRVQTPQALAAQLGDMAFFGLPDDYLQTYLPKLRAVTLADVNRIAKNYFAPETLSTVLVAPLEKVKTQLKGFSTPEVIPAAEVGKGTGPLTLVQP
jgi:zinc protease